MKTSYLKYLPIFLIGGIFLLSAVVPVSVVSNIPLCHIKALIGLDCPGCGLTRAFLYLFKGDFRHAMMLNAMAPVLVVFFSLYGLGHLIHLRRGVRPDWFTPQGNQWIGRLFLVLFLGQWILKNLSLGGLL